MTYQFPSRGCPHAAPVARDKWIEQADEYAASRGLTFSDVVADALRRLIKRKSA